MYKKNGYAAPTAKSDLQLSMESHGYKCMNKMQNELCKPSKSKSSKGQAITNAYLQGTGIISRLGVHDQEFADQVLKMVGDRKDLCLSALS